MTDSIDSGPVRLRRYADRDIDDVASACSDPMVQRFIPSMPRPYTRDTAAWWVRSGAQAVWDDGNAAFAVVDPRTDRLLGGVGLGATQQERGITEVGYWAAPWARRRGVATAAADMITRWAFTRGLARVELMTLWENTASQRVALSAGFQREGVRRSAIIGAIGERHDAIAWCRLATDPAGPVARLLPDLPGGQLTDGAVTLRPLGEGDVDFLHELRCLPEVVNTSVPPREPERADTAERCSRAEARWLAGDRADLVILDAATGAAAGDIGLRYGEPQTGQAMLGCSVLPRWRGRGYVGRALRLLAPWAFSVGIARLVAGARPDNLASQRALERAGFQREGYARARLPGPSGVRIDDVSYALLPGDPMRAPTGSAGG
ncbi:GNAT family N-acetyltransferase [Pilimelia columellifera]|uniref:N-acetyltransferase domain-containing protein n=1 Tax=Pilimelia columellifera subsp. columellifera TaxID=706583 RepID=A0ABP6AUG4_9ACTN